MLVQTAVKSMIRKRCLRQEFIKKTMNHHQAVNSNDADKPLSGTWVARRRFLALYILIEIVNVALRDKEVSDE